MGIGSGILSLLLAGLQAHAAAGGPVSLPLVPAGQEAGTRLCVSQSHPTDRRLCFALSEPDSGAARELIIWSGDEPEPHSRLPVPYSASDDETLTLLPIVIRYPLNVDDAPGYQGLLIGLLVGERVMYSGGGGGAQRLHLHELTQGPGRPFVDQGEVLSLPWQASLMIRACFAETDGERRRGACHDEYDFRAELALAPQERSRYDRPTLRYTTEATAYPRTARRREDSSADRPLRAADLAHWRDPDCSYTRTLAFNPATERYEMDRPAPDCSDYTVP